VNETGGPPQPTGNARVLGVRGLRSGVGQGASVPELNLEREHLMQAIGKGAHT
jgi:hypothetical protein